MARILIIGTGFAGLGMAIRLRQAGIEDFVLLEQADRIGGTWRDNHYPGAACDVESHLYSYSFAPNPDWSRSFAPWWEIQEYLERCTDEFGIRDKIRFGKRVVKATFDEAAALWRVETADGEVLTARSVVAGCGGLSRPADPDIPGLADFTGPQFHSARWQDDVSLSGKRVGVIGTGASAIQIVPSIAEQVGELKVFQRTPPWIVPKDDHEIPARKRARFRKYSWLHRLERYLLYWKHEAFAVGFIKNPRILEAISKLVLLNLKKSVADPVLREKLTPHYTLGCKRILLSNDYYPALQRDNVELLTEGIDRVVPNGIRTKDGALHELDVLVLATGFQAAEAVAPFPVTGRGGRELQRDWQQGAEAYLGTTISGYPNLFMIVGPNTGLGHSSMVFMIEAQIGYILDCIRMMRERDVGFVDVKREAQDRYNREIHARLDKTVWATGCVSWYRTASGKNTTLWPGFTFEYWRRLRQFDPDSYELGPAGPEQVAAFEAETASSPL